MFEKDVKAQEYIELADQLLAKPDGLTPLEWIARLPQELSEMSESDIDLANPEEDLDPKFHESVGVLSENLRRLRALQVKYTILAHIVATTVTQHAFFGILKNGGGDVNELIGATIYSPVSNALLMRARILKSMFWESVNIELKCYGMPLTIANGWKIIRLKGNEVGENFGGDIFEANGILKDDSGPATFSVYHNKEHQC